MNSLKRVFICAILITFFTAAFLSARDLGGLPAGPEKSPSIPSLTDNLEYIDAISWPPPYSFWLLQTDQVGTIYSNQGLFGIGFSNNNMCDGELCPSFESPEGSDLEYLFAGALWVGGIVGSDTLVSVAADGWFTGIFEFCPTRTGQEFSGPGDQSVWMIFNDTISDPDLINADLYDNRPHIPLNIRVANRAYAWDFDPLNQTIIYDLVITNIGEEFIQDGYVAFLFDADVYHTSNNNGWSDDITGALRDDGIAYIIDNDGDPVGGEFVSTSPTRLFAFKFLGVSQAVTDTGYNWWISNGNPSLDFGPQPVDEFGNLVCDFDGRSGTPTGDVNKYCIMSHPGWDYDQFRTADSMPGWNYPAPNVAVDFADGHDTRFLMSLGPFNLMPDSSVRFLYTLFTGESVIHVPDNITNLPDDPNQYFANLNFTNVLTNAAAADAMVSSLIDPLNPPIGLYVLYNDPDSVIIEWDPWGYSEVIGYNVYFYEIPTDSMPYPGVAPPWIKPTEYDLQATLGAAYQYKFESLPLHQICLVSLANRTATETGVFCDPVLVQPGGRPPAPLVDNIYSFIQPGDPAAVSWAEPEGIEIDHYNIYKFGGAAEAAAKYYPLYDKGEFSVQIAPKDSFFVDDIWYFYYAMEPYAQVDFGTTQFTEYTDDSTVYVVTAVTTNGMESAFSDEVTVLEIPLRTKDILVVVCPTSDNLDFAVCDSVINFYDSVLQGYDYDLYDMFDTTKYADFGPDKFCMDLMPYRLVIYDGSIRQDILSSNSFFETVAGTEKFIWSGGILLNFGAMRGLSPRPQIPPEYNAYYDSFVSDFLGIDSIFNMEIDYYLANVTEDTVMGLDRAESIYGAMPDVTYDDSRSTLRVPFWDPNVAPLPATFRNSAAGEVTHVFRSLYPEKSWVEGDPIGIRAQTRGTLAYTFGFHLYCMNYDDARGLIDYAMSETEFYAVAMTSIEPDSMDATEPLPDDPASGAIYLGNVTGGYTVADIDQSSLLINHSLDPAGIEILSSHPPYDGPVMKLNFALNDFADGYGLCWDEKAKAYRITGFLSNGYAFSSTGHVFIKGYMPGNANDDAQIDIGDAVFLINYLFRFGSPPVPMALGDANGDCFVDVGDAVYLINYIFKYGASPLPGCAP